LSVAVDDLGVGAAMTLTWAVVTTSDSTNVWLGLFIAWLADGIAATMIVAAFRRRSRSAGHDRDATGECSSCSPLSWRARIT
jgi:hypothetical protein